MSADKIQTLIERFYHWEKTTPDKVFLRQPKGTSWIEITFAEAGQTVRKMVTALKSQGLKPGDHIGIYSKNFGNASEIAKVLQHKGLNVQYKKHFFGCATSVSGRKPLM